jgi:RHS repeat-associated protein
MAHDYLPFGGELYAGSNGRSSCFPTPPSGGIEFTSKERDSETGLDFFGARYFSGAQGRFTSPDGPFNDQDPSDPQSWNLYGYVRNNPLRAVDPNGQECVTLDGGGKGDDGKGNFCSDKSLLTTHGVTVNGTTDTVTSAVFGNAVLMGDIDPSGRRDRIHDASEDVLNALPFAKTALLVGKIGLPLAVVIGKDRLEHVLARHAANSLAKDAAKFSANLSKEEIEALINRALSEAPQPGTKVSFHDLDVGTHVGTNLAGQASTTIRVLVDNVTGKAITAYPK